MGEKYMGEKSVGEKYMGEKSVGAKYGGEKPVEKESLGEESLGEKIHKISEKSVAGESPWLISIWVKTRRICM